MTRVEKTVFLSYRRVDLHSAMLVFKDLTQHGYDVFIDYDGIASGDFEQAIVDNINARAHFVLLLTPTALDRSVDPSDWLRREIEAAIAARRNIVPVLLSGFSAKAATEKMTGSLEALRRYNALDVPDSFFDAAMERLRHKYLAVPIDAVLHPASPHAQQVAMAQQQAATAAPNDVPPTGETLPAQRSTGEPSTAQIPAQAPTERRRPIPAVDAGMDGNMSPHAGRVPSKWPHWRIATIWLLGVALAPLLLWLLLPKPAGAVPELPLVQATVGVPSPAIAATSSAGEGQDQGPTDPAAQKERGDDFYFGLNGFKQSDTEALKWYRKSADQGDAASQAVLGTMYERGAGVPQDRSEAVRLYRLAAKQGHHIAVQGLRRLGEP